MNKAFLHQQWLAFWRSQNTGKSMAVSILLWLTMLYLFANLLIVSFFLDKILMRVLPDEEVIEAFNGLVLYYFLFDLLMRFQLQELPTLMARPYLTLPVNKNKIVSYLSITSLWTGFNLSPFMLMVPFLMKVLLFEGRIGDFFALLICIIGLTLLNHFFSVWLKRKVNLNAWFMVAFLLALAGILLLDFKTETVSVSNFSAYIFNAVLSFPVLCTMFMLLSGLMFYINYLFLKSSLYLDDMQKGTSRESNVTDIPFLRKFGMAGELAALEIKLILRNKRPRSTLIMSGVFMLYGLIFYRRNQPDETIMIFAALMMTGIFIINYGQFMFSWQSSHFDGVLASRISASEFFKSKFLLFTLFSTVTLIITIPYVYFGWNILLAHARLYLWNIGESSVIVLAFANWNYKYIDLSKGSSFNWEGVGASQFIIGIPLFLCPLLIFILMKWLFSPVAGMLVLGLIGCLFILTRLFWLTKLTAMFNRKRYIIAEGFRNH